MESSRRMGFFAVVGLSIVAVLFASIQVVTAFKTLALYNLVRALVFAAVAIYLHRNPAKIDFFGKIKSSSGGSGTPLNMKVSYALSYLFAAVNLAISLVLFFDP